MGVPPVIGAMRSSCGEIPNVRNRWPRQSKTAAYADALLIFKHFLGLASIVHSGGLTGADTVMRVDLGVPPQALPS
jgi:hypothetical protein